MNYWLMENLDFLQLIMQLLRDNLTLWTSDLSESGVGGAEKVDEPSAAPVPADEVEANKA
jgi:hypothetical protein